MPRSAMYCGPFIAAGNLKAGCGEEMRGRRHRELRIGEPRGEQQQIAVAQKRRDLPSVPQSPAARDLHGNSIEHTERDEFRGFDGRDYAFIHQDRQGALSLERLVVANPVRWQRRLERSQAEVCQLRRHRSRGVEIIARIGVAPMKSAGREGYHLAHQFEIVCRRLRVTDLDVEIGVTLSMGERELLLGAFERWRIHRPAQFDLTRLRATEKIAHRAARLLAPEIVAGEIDRGLAQWLTDRERRPDRALHARMDVRNVARVGAEDCGGEIMTQRGLDRLDCFVGPGLDRNRLSPSLDAVLVGQAHQHGRPRPRLEELEFTDERIVVPLDVDADNASHLSSAGLRRDRARAPARGSFCPQCRA